MSELAASKIKGVPRPKSEVAFPYYNLDASIDVATKIHEQAGGSCTRDQLAPMLNYNGTKNGGFLSRLGAARMFGLVEDVNGMLRPTQLAQQIYAPVQPADAERGKVQAFLNVELFSKVYDRFKGQPLPNDQGMENLLRNELKVVPAQIKTALRILNDSAESAGFFNAAGKGRLVMPLVANTRSTVTPVSTVTLDGVQPATPTPSQVSQSRNSTDDTSIPPAIFGLIRDLPAEGSAMTKAKRERLIKAFEASINYLYPDDGEEDANG